MNANELRIGNFVSYEEKVWQVNSILPITKTYLDYEPIPLTEEWLVKFGALKSPLNDSLFIGVDAETRLEVWPDRHTRLWRNWPIKWQENFSRMPNKLEHVHQLQNMYFALTGEELTVK